MQPEMVNRVAEIGCMTFENWESKYLEKFDHRRGKRVNGSALPPRLTDWKGNPFTIRSVLIRSDSRHTCIRFGFPAPRPVALSSLAISSVASYLLRKYSRRSFNTWPMMPGMLSDENDAFWSTKLRRDLSRSTYADIFVFFFFSFTLENI